MFSCICWSIIKKKPEDNLGPCESNCPALFVKMEIKTSFQIRTNYKTSETSERFVSKLVDSFYQCLHVFLTAALCSTTTSNYIYAAANLQQNKRKKKSEVQLHFPKNMMTKQVLTSVKT